MENYNEIREKELETTKDYNEKKFNRYLTIHKILRNLYSDFFFWSVSLIPFIIFSFFFLHGSYLFFLISHFIFWEFKGKKIYHKYCVEDIEELEMVIQVLKDIQKEKFEK